MAPPDPFLQQNAPDLAPLHLNACVVSCACQGIETPLGLLLWLAGTELVAHAHWLPGRRRASKGTDAPAFLLRQPVLPACSWAITQSIHPLNIEAQDQLTDGLGMTGQVLGDGGRAFPFPTADDHSGSSDPVTLRMATSRQLPNLLLFVLITRRSCKQEFWHGDLLVPPAYSYSYPL